MLTSRFGRSAILPLTGMMAIAAAGCSKDSGNSTRAETASSTAGTAVATDSAARGTDTSASVRISDTGATAPKQAAAARVAKPAPATAATPRPSAGAVSSERASPKPRPDTTPTAKPATNSAATTAAPAPPTAQEKWVSYDAAKNTVTFELIAGPFTFNGYSGGEGSLTVPSNTNMVVNFVNKDGTPHSAEVISGEGPIPNAAVDPAIPRAYTNKLLEGLPQEATDVMRFSVPASGSYRFFCGVPGHGLSGMWIWLKVDPAAKAPSFGPTKKI